MCGISFLWHPSLEADDLSAALGRMVRAQAHRGPDVSCARVVAGAGIGHNRLRVVDLDPRADQPFGAEGARSLLAYNGEVYNAPELRSELASLGVAFHTTSDTEVLYHALERWGTDAIARLDGMFAFALYDPERRTLLLARDRMGIKPLHYASTPELMIVASEIKGIIASGLVAPRLDPFGIYQTIRHNHTLGATTAFDGIASLLPGTWMTVDLDGGEVTTERYWRPVFGGGRRSYEERVRRLDAAFTEAVWRQSRADVPVVAFVSGGLDSSGLAIEAARTIGDGLETFSMVLPGETYDESPFVDELLAEHPLRNRKVPISGITLDQYAGYIASAEMPQWWTTDLSLKLLSRAVHESGRRVAFSGEGPDELLAGYETYRNMRIRALVEACGLAPLARSERLAGLVVKGLRSWYHLDTSMLRYYLGVHRRDRERELVATYGFHPENLAMWELLLPVLEPLMSDHFRAMLPELRRGEERYFRENVAPAVEGLSPLHADLSFETTERLPNWILQMSDHMSAAHGVELRVPYLANGVVDAMLELPERDRLRGLEGKRILKDAHRDRVPAAIRKRRKQPLYTPALGWMRPLFDDPEFERTWSREAFADAGLFDFDRAEALRRRLLAAPMANELEQLSSEWSLCWLVSLHLLDRTMKGVAAEAQHIPNTV